MLIKSLAAALLGICVLPLAAADIDVSQFAAEDTIDKDVAIIGGGASGSHAAIRLREDFNMSVIVVEKQPILGGHVDTYIDEETGDVHDFGVQVYFPYLDAMSFIYKVGMTVEPFGRGNTPLPTRYVDFSTGKELPSSFKPTDRQKGMDAMRRFHNLVVSKGWDTMTQPGYWNLPAGDKIPEDLLLPIGQFMKKHDLADLLPLMYPSTGGGVGSRGKFEDIMTLSVMKSFPDAWVKSYLGDVGMYKFGEGNQELYNAIGKILDTDVLYNATVASTERNDTLVKLVVQTPAGKKLIQAKKLLLAISPTRENMAPFDLNAHETELFSKPKYGRSQLGIISHSKLPTDVILRNTPASAEQNPLSPFLQTPFVLSISHYGSPSKLYSMGASSDNFTGYGAAEAQAAAQTALEKMAAAGTIPDLKGEKLKVVAWADHEAGGFGVLAEDMRKGWMSDFYALQGKRSTWYTGGAIAADFTPMLWKFNDDLLPRIAKDMGRPLPPPPEGLGPAPTPFPAPAPPPPAPTP